MQAGVLRVGETCAALDERADAAVLVDGDAFFRAFRAAAEQAERAIYVAGWAIDPLAQLEPGGETLEDLFARLSRARRELHVHVLVWDPAASVGLGQLHLPIFGQTFRSGRRFHLRYDPRVPLGGSHHEKVVVVDDSICLVGGIDLTVGRWDTPEHLPSDPRRRDAAGHEHKPFHDAAMLTAGPVAAHLGERFRARWSRAARGGDALAAPPRRAVDVGALAPEPELVFRGVSVACAHTDRAHAPPTRQVEELFLSSIAAAERTLYLENQYLTSRSVGRALSERLKRERGPEVVVVGPRQPSGWLEEVTVGLLRWQIVESLRASDGFGRLHVHYPMASVARDVAVYVHAKLSIVDDDLVRIGSANIARRSMSIDTETDLCLVARTDEHRARIRALRERLVAEHLGLAAGEVRRALEAEGSLGRAIEALRGGDRTLVPFDHAPSVEERELAMQNDLLIDPDEPIRLAGLLDAVTGGRSRRRLRDGLPAGFLRVVAFCGALIAYRFYLVDRVGALAAFAAWMREHAATAVGSLEIVGLLGLAATAGVPLVVIAIVTAVVHGGALGVALALGGMMTAAVVTYGVGGALGRDLVRRLFRRRLNPLSARMLRRGALAFVLLRLFPVLGFASVGVVGGASRVRFTHYLLGTAIGGSLYVLAFSLLGNALRAFLFRPGPTGFVLLVGVVWLLWLVVGGASSALARRRRTSADGERGVLAP